MLLASGLMRPQQHLGSAQVLAVGHQQRAGLWALRQGQQLLLPGQLLRWAGEQKPDVQTSKVLKACCCLQLPLLLAMLRPQPLLLLVLGL
jgi:hypothetical protein